MCILDITYNHLLYSTYGPICITLNSNNVTKIQTNNGTGKTVFLKSILGLIAPKKGLIYTSDIGRSLFHVHSTGFRRLSNSQTKKLKLITSYLNKSSYWILDEPYSYLDITSVHFYKKKFIESTLKNHTILITDCIQKSMLPTLIFYFGIKWI